MPATLSAATRLVCPARRQKIRVRQPGEMADVLMPDNLHLVPNSFPPRMWLMLQVNNTNVAWFYNGAWVKKVRA